MQHSMLGHHFSGIWIQLNKKVGPLLTKPSGSAHDTDSHIATDYQLLSFKVSKEAKIRNRYNQVPHLTKDTTRESDTIIQYIKESQEVSHFPAGDHKAAVNRQENMTKMINKRCTSEKKSGGL